MIAGMITDPARGGFFFLPRRGLLTVKIVNDRRIEMDFIKDIVTLATSAGALLRDGTETAQKLRELLKGGKGNSTEAQALALDLFNQILDAKRNQSTLEDRLRQLERELKDRDEFQAQAARYVLTDTGRGAAVYALKPDDTTGEPFHRICPECYRQRQKSILQPDPENHRAFIYCPACRARFMIVGENSPIITGSGRSRELW